jgi:iron-sulfur cluster assembly protein
MKKDVITITPTATKRILDLIHAREKPSIGIRIGVRTRGCSGYSYTIEYADDVKSFEEVVDIPDYKVCIDPKALLFLMGTQMDYVDEKLQSGFVFKNPNEKGRCGCGESFHV